MTSPTPDLQASDWTDGWWSHAQPWRSPHHDQRPAGVEVDLLVVHCISLPPGEYGSDDVPQLFMGRLVADTHPYHQGLRGLRVSSHFVIRRDGQILQFVSVRDRAWHAGLSQHLGRPRCNDFSVGVELEGLVGHTFEPAQYVALARLAHALALVLPLRHVAGHEHIAPERKSDPGAGMDWSRLRHDIQDLAWCFP